MILEPVAKLAKCYKLFHLGYQYLQGVAIFVTAQCTTNSSVSFIYSKFSDMATRFSEFEEPQIMYNNVYIMKKDYSVLLFQLGRNLASDVSTRCSGHP